MASLPRASLLIAAAAALAASQEAAPQARGSRACANDEPAALLQKNLVLQRRGAEEGAGLPPTDGMSLKTPLAPRSDAAMLAAAAKKETELTEPGLGVEQGMHPSSKARSVTQTIVVCVVVLVLLTICWVSFLLGTEFSPLKESIQLPLHIFSFVLCYWALSIVDQTLMQALSAPMLVTCGQMLLTAAFCFIAAPRQIRGHPAEVFLWCLVPSIFLALMVCSLFTYEYFTIIMVLRNMSPMMAMPIETMLMPADKHPRLTIPMVFALAIIAGSTLLYTSRFEVSPQGLALAFLNVVLVVADCLVQRRLLTTECRGLSSTCCLFINNVFAFFPTLLLGLYHKEYDRLSMTLWLEHSGTWLLVLAGAIGACLAYSAIALQRQLSATSFLVLQNLVRVVVLLIGALVFLDLLASPITELGLALSFAGAGWYGKTQLEGLKRKEPHPFEVAATASPSAKQCIPKAPAT